VMALLRFGCCLKQGDSEICKPGNLILRVEIPT
jgi:hypothetical protein